MVLKAKSAAVTAAWRPLDRHCPRPVPAALDAGDECYYLHDYLVAQPSNACEGTSLIRDFKLNPELPGYGRRRFWKEEACREFSLALSAVLPWGFAVCHVPGSKRPGDPGHDPRFTLLFDCLGACRPDLRLEAPLAVAQSRRAAHEGGPRSRRHFLGLLRWRGLRRPAAEIAIVDDVITTGAHFKACQQVLAAHGIGRVVGFFFGLAMEAPATPDAAELVPGASGAFRT